MPETTAPPASEDGSKPPKPGGEGKSVDGKFLPGNNFWKARSSHGRKPIFETPEDLWSACVEYFEWVEANPLYERKVFHNGGKVVHADVPKLRRNRPNHRSRGQFRCSENQKGTQRCHQHPN